MFGLTYLGIGHTLISLIALVSGLILLIRDGAISWKSMTGKIYVITTIIVCITGFGIFQHGGFGKAHALGIITLIVLAVALIAGGKNQPFGKASKYIETVCFSATFFFHLIPTIAETTTRLPLGAPIAASPDDPRIQLASGICFLLFIVGAIAQVLRLRNKSH